MHSFYILGVALGLLLLASVVSSLNAVIPLYSHTTEYNDSTLFTHYSNVMD